MKCSVMKLSAEGTSAVAEMTLADQVFAYDYRQDLIHLLVMVYIAGSHLGTKATKNRSAVRGGGAKPRRQKGGGCSRMGTRSSPLLRSGGVTFAADPSKQNSLPKLNKKMRRAAMCSVFSELLRSERLTVLDDFSVDSHKTKVMADKLTAFRGQRLLVIVSEVSDQLALAARNLHYVDITLSTSLSPVALVSSDQVFVTQEAIKQIEERLL